MAFGKDKPIGTEVRGGFAREGQEVSLVMKEFVAGWLGPRVCLSALVQQLPRVTFTSINLTYNKKIKIKIVRLQNRSCISLHWH